MLAGQFSGMASEAKITPILIVCCVIASTGGLTSGYCLAVVTGLGSILSLESFMNKFYPVEYRRMMNSNPDSPGSNYCLDDGSKERRPFEGSLFWLALTTTFFASYTTRRLGRKPTMLIVGVFFIVGIILSFPFCVVKLQKFHRWRYRVLPSKIVSITYLRIIRVVVVIFEILHILVHRLKLSKVVLFYAIRLIEISFLCMHIYRIRGGRGWRLSLGLAGIPAVIFTIGSFFIVETPNSLIERGHLEKGKAVLGMAAPYPSGLTTGCCPDLSWTMPAPLCLPMLSASLLVIIGTTLVDGGCIIWPLSSKPLFSINCPLPLLLNMAGPLIAPSGVPMEPRSSLSNPLTPSFSNRAPQFSPSLGRVFGTSRAPQVLFHSLEDPAFCLAYC